MKNLKLLFLLIPNLIFCQKLYEIGQTKWIYSSPESYIYRTDNFSEVAEVGQKVLKQQENVNLDTDEKILFSLAKDQESTFNIIFSSYLSNENIQNFGAEIYSDKLMDIFKKNFRRS